MSKKYGYFYEEELDKWEHLPATMLVLTSSYMGAWLLRRDERKGNRERIEELKKLKAEIEEHNRKYLSDDNAGLERAIWDFIEPRISELKGETE